MAESYRQILEEVLEEHGLVCGLVASSAGVEYARTGDFGRLDHTGLVNALVGDGASIARLDASVDGQIMPQLWSQGGTHAYVTKPKKDLLVVWFTQDDIDAITRYGWARGVNASLMSKIANQMEK